MHNWGQPGIPRHRPLPPDLGYGPLQVGVFAIGRGMSRARSRDPSLSPEPTYKGSTPDDSSFNSEHELPPGASAPLNWSLNPGRASRRQHYQWFHQFSCRYHGGKRAVQRWAIEHLSAMHWGHKAPALPWERADQAHKWEHDAGHRRGRSRFPRPTAHPQQEPQVQPRQSFH